jgi:hypothetical protein
MIGQLFQITFLHDYFPDGKLGNCRVVADADTARIIDRYRLLPRMEQGVFSLNTVFQEEPAALAAYLSQQLGAEPLRFSLLCDEQLFFQVTDLPLDWVGQLQLGSRAAARTAGGALAMTPVLSGDPAGGNGAIAVISIWLDDLLLMGGENVRYVVEFQARSVGWRYYLINRSQVVLKNPAIVGKSGQSFSGPDAVVLPGGENALSFSSENDAFPLRQFPRVMFDLVDRMVLPSPSREQTVEHCLIKGLPTPTAGQLNIARTGQSQIYCAMHVYL